jgi:hypothetical protein
MNRPIAALTLLMTLAICLPVRGQAFPPEMAHESVVFYETLDAHRVTPEAFKAAVQTLLGETREGLDAKVAEFTEWRRKFTALGGERVSMLMAMAGSNSMTATLLVKVQGAGPNRAAMKSIGDLMHAHSPEWVGPAASLGADTPWFEYGTRDRWRLPRTKIDPRRQKLFAAALAAGEDAPLWGCLVPSDAFRSFARSTLEGNQAVDPAIVNLLDAAWISVSARAGPSPSGRIVVQFADAGVAARYAKVLGDGLERMKKTGDQPPDPAEADWRAFNSEVAANVRPVLGGSQIVMDLDTDSLRPLARAASAWLGEKPLATTQPATAPANAPK